MTIFLAYLPIWVLALPLLGILLASMLFLCWRSAALSFSCAMLIPFWLGGYSFFYGPLPPQEPGTHTLTVMTYNRGQGSDKILTACASAHRPDIAVFQDAGRRLLQLAALPEFYQHQYKHQSGEFVLLSRWPLLENEALQLEWPFGKNGFCNAGTRSVIDWHGQEVVVYNIHFPTPRDLLYWYAKRGTFLYGVLGLIPNTPLHARHQHYLAYWVARVGLAAQLAVRVRAESKPVILLGDLNAPPLGQGYSLLGAVLQDAQKTAGNGFGFTFPGNFKFIGNLLAPWLRIDHVFASSHWEILSCIRCSSKISQHLPVVSMLKIKQIENI